MRRAAAALWLGLLLGPSAHAEAVNDGNVSIAAHRGGATFVFIAQVSKLEPGLRDRLLRSASPQALPADDGGSERAVVSPMQPLGTPFATWSGRALQGFDGSRAVCSRTVGRIVLFGSVPGTGEPSPEAMQKALSEGVVAGEIDDRAQVCRGADLFHDSALGPLHVADATTTETTTPQGRDEILGGEGRLQLQPEWVHEQELFLAQKNAPSLRAPDRAPSSEAPPVAATSAPPHGWDKTGPKAVRFALGSSPYVAAVSASPGCARTVARLFHAMNQPILIWPSLTFESPSGSLPRWVADTGDLWPVVSLDGSLLSPDGDHYTVTQHFPGTPVPDCRTP